MVRVRASKTRRLEFESLRSCMELQDWNLECALREHPQFWSLSDVETVALAVDNSDEKDEPDYTWILKLKGGQWLAVRGWHDYTGWDCQSGLTTEKYASESDAFRTLVDWERDVMEKQAAKPQ